MNIETMRQKIMEVYPGTSWQARCMKMMPNQVIAIFRSFQNKGKFDKRTREGREIKAREIQEQETGHQITIFEYLNSLKRGG